MTKNTYDDKDDTAHAETMKHSRSTYMYVKKSSQKKGGSSQGKKRPETHAQRKSSGRDHREDPGGGAEDALAEPGLPLPKK